MTDRMDIDALLIGSLYGELTPADQARLQTHLESHPADRSVLADLTHARQVVRESRLFELQFEPPQAVSALLLQEAARRAPRMRATKPNAERGESWFQRFMRSLAAHPAMAAAAMLVIVLGAAGILYNRNGGTQNWEPRAEQAAPVAPPSSANAQGEAEGAGAAAKRDNFAVDLASEEKLKQQQQTLDAGAVAAATPTDKPAEPAAKPPAKAADPAAPRKQPPYIEVDRGPQPEPKELGDDVKAKPDVRGNKESQAAESARLDESQNQSAKRPAAGRVGNAAPPPGASHSGSATTNNGFGGDTTTTSSGAAAPTGGAGAGGAPGPAPAPTSPSTNRKLETTKDSSKDARRPTAPPPASTPAPAPPPPPPAAPAQQAPASREKTVQKGTADKSDADKNAEDLSWARSQHQKVIAAVKANRCMQATNLALDLQNRAPAYYAQNVENDRAIKTCSSYIANERAKRVEAEKARAKASERRVDEPARAAPTSDK